LVPSPINVRQTFLRRGRLLELIAVQQWVLTELKLPLPLLHGTFVLARSCHTDALQPGSTAAAASGRKPAAAPAAAVSPSWRLREVLGVEAAPYADPADATLVLTGGQRARAGSVCAHKLADVQDYQVRARL
jgi:hypothetical protein